MPLSKVTLTLGLINSAGLFAVSYITYQRSSIVYIDSNKIINNYKGMLEARKVFQQKATGWKDNIDTLAD